MRLLVDEHRMDWEPAWSITCKTFAYTNHAAARHWRNGRWPVRPAFTRHLEIILEINTRFLGEVRARFLAMTPGLTSLSIIDESGERYVRMAHLAAAGSHHINGVARLHSGSA
jgi:starch phosphorylase